MWYDTRMPNVLNRNTRAIKRQQVVGLFPRYATEIRSITVIPQIARQLAVRTKP